MGLLLARKILGYDVDHMTVNTEQEYHEIKQSDKIARDHYQLGAHSRPRVTSRFDSDSTWLLLFDPPHRHAGLPAR